MPRHRLGHRRRRRRLAAEVELVARSAHVRLDDRDATTGPDAALRALGLTDREIEVLGLVAEGRSNRQISDALFIIAKTASIHVSHIVAEFGVGTRTDAASRAYHLGAVPLGGRPGQRQRGSG